MEQALRSIAMFVEDAASDRHVVLWGHDAQRRFGAIVSRAVDLSEAPVLTRTARYLRRMVEILGKIDVEAICGAASGTGLFGRVLRRTNDRIDTVEELEVARTEIDQLVGLTDAALEELLALRQALEKHRHEYGETAEAIEASSLAAGFLSEHLRGTREDLSRRFLERSMSLAQSLAQLHGGASVADIQAEQPLRLVAAIQNGVLVAVPGLLGSFAALSTLSRNGGRLNPTEAGELALRLRDVLRQINI